MKHLKSPYYLIIAILSIILISCSGGNTPVEETRDISDMTEEEILELAQGIHERVITLDTHVDINTDNFTEERNYTQELDNQVTLPKMQEGGLDVAWFIVYTGQGELTDEGYSRAFENAMPSVQSNQNRNTKV